jgi:hypothetical protein
MFRDVHAAAKHDRIGFAAVRGGELCEALFK